MAYRYLTFDCYGTLVDWRTGIEKALLSALGDINLRGKELMDAYARAEKEEEATYKKYREVLRRSAVSLSKELRVKVDDKAARGFAASVPMWPAFPDTAKFLREMGSRGYKRYVLSNVDDDLLEGTIERNHLEVDGFVTAEQVGSYKPDTEHWTEFRRRTGAGKEQILHVAQSIYHDILPTQRLGIASAWVNRYAEPLPRDAAPLIITDSLSALARSID
jgi:2-haloalkanoic acid dehalogenase type II